MFDKKACLSASFYRSFSLSPSRLPLFLLLSFSPNTLSHSLLLAYTAISHSRLLTYHSFSLLLLTYRSFSLSPPRLSLFLILSFSTTTLSPSLLLAYHSFSLSPSRLPLFLLLSFSPIALSHSLLRVYRSFSLSPLLLCLCLSICLSFFFSRCKIYLSSSMSPAITQWSILSQPPLPPLKADLSTFSQLGIFAWKNIFSPVCQQIH